MSVDRCERHGQYDTDYYVDGCPRCETEQVENEYRAFCQARSKWPPCLWWLFNFLFIGKKFT